MICMGQPKAIRKYGLKADYTKDPYATSAVEYYYNADESYLMKVNSEYSKTVSRLDNLVPTINEDNNGSSPIVENKLVGVEYDFFH